jgi:hypothetical protein
MGQNDVIVGTCWGTNWELKEDVEKPGKLMGTHRGKKSNTPPPSPKRNSTHCVHGSHHWLPRILMHSCVIYHF